MSSPREKEMWPSSLYQFLLTAVITLCGRNANKMCPSTIVLTAITVLVSKLKIPVETHYFNG